ncbi:MAG: hypothetical protein FIA89_07330 [Geobacter sp.]|nr:hypothetical protein [Geobacter sp.]
MKTGLKMILAGLLLVAVAVVAGCGSGSMSSTGTLSCKVEKTTPSMAKATATYSPAGGVLIAFNWRVYDSTGVLVDSKSIGDVKAGETTGIATSDYNFNALIPAGYNVCVSAKTGGLTNSEGTVCVTY